MKKMFQLVEVNKKYKIMASYEDRVYLQCYHEFCGLTFTHLGKCLCLSTTTMEHGDVLILRRLIGDDCFEW